MRWSILVASLVVATTAHAADRKDGAHGRVDGDLAIEAGVGASFGPRSPRAAADLRFRYLSMTGIFVTYEDGPLFGTRAEPKRALATGLELRPLFLARWFTGHYTGSAHLDLAIDSLGLELGAVFMQPDNGTLGSKPGLQDGGSPSSYLCFPPRPDHSSPCTPARAGATPRSRADRSSAPPIGLYLNVVFAWQQVFGAHVVDLGDRAP